MDSSDSEAGASGGPTDVGSAARDTASPRTSPEKEEAKEVVDKKDEEEKKKEEEKKDEPNKPDDKKDSGGDGDEDGDNASDPWGTGGCSFAKDCHYYNGPSRPPDGPPPEVAYAACKRVLISYGTNEPTTEEQRHSVTGEMCGSGEPSSGRTASVPCGGGRDRLVQTQRRALYP